jgi:hypothetical protein
VDCLFKTLDVLFGVISKSNRFLYPAAPKGVTNINDWEMVGYFASNYGGLTRSRFWI